MLLISGKWVARLTVQIMKDLWQVGGMELTDPSDAAVYLVRFGDKAALIDAGTGRRHDKLLTNIRRCLNSNEQIEYLLLTHCHFDHAGGARALREEFGCRIAAHELDAAYLESGDNRVTGAARYNAVITPFHIDVTIQAETSTLVIGNSTVTAVHCPGHSPGSVVYTVTIEGGENPAGNQ